MRCSPFKPILIVICASFWLLSGHLEAKGEEPANNEEENLFLQWLDPFWSSLETSSVSQFRASSAIRLIQTDHPASVKQGTEILKDVLHSSNPDAVSLWTIASACLWIETADWCQSGEAYRMLEKADPGNAAAWLLRFDQLQPAHDENRVYTDQERKLFARAAQAERFDSYWGRGLAEFYNTIIAYANSNPPSGELLASMSDAGTVPTIEQLALGASMSLSIYTPSVAYQAKSVFCRQETAQNDLESIAACRKLAKMMRHNSSTSLSRAIGYAFEIQLLKAMDPTDPGIQRWELRKQVNRKMFECYLPPQMKSFDGLEQAGSGTIVDLLENIDKLGEWEGIRQYAINLYDKAPTDFAFNPEKCDRLQRLDNDDIMTLLDGQTIEEAWKAIEAES